MKESEKPSASPKAPTPTQSAPMAESGEPTTSLALVPKQSGLGLKARRAINRHLTSHGLPEEDLPLQLRDITVKKSRKGKAGQITLRALSGVQKSPAAQLARRLEHDLSEGREDIIEKLQASGGSNQAVLQVAELLTTNPQFSLARAIVEAGADVAHVLDHYARGALALKKMETVLGLYREMPNLMRDLMRHAVDREGSCATCFGEGKVTPRANGKVLSKTCPSCSGTGKAYSASDHKALAVQKILEMSEMLPKKQGLAVNVNQAVQVNNQGGGSEILARLSKAADEILYGRVPTGTVVDAEVVDE